MFTHKALQKTQSCFFFPFLKQLFATSIKQRKRVKKYWTEYSIIMFEIILLLWKWIRELSLMVFLGFFLKGLAVCESQVVTLSPSKNTLTLAFTGSFVQDDENFSRGRCRQNCWRIHYKRCHWRLNCVLIVTVVLCEHSHNIHVILLKIGGCCRNWRSVWMSLTV